MMARLRGLLRGEDALLVAWSLLGLPLVLVLVGGAAGNPGGGTLGVDAPLRGLVYVVGAASALAALATRTAMPAAVQPPPGAFVAVRPAATRSPAEPSIIAGHTGILGPLFGGILFLSARGLENLGFADAPFPFIILGVGAALVLQASNRAPVVPASLRRLLVAPFVLAGTLLFNEVIGGFGIGPGLVGAVLASTPSATPFGPAGDTGSYLLFVFGIVTAGAAIFYTMLVAAPRIMVEREGNILAWAVRFAAWFAGTLAGMGWVAALGR